MRRWLILVVVLLFLGLASADLDEVPNLGIKKLARKVSSAAKKAKLPKLKLNLKGALNKAKEGVEDAADSAPGKVAAVHRNIGRVLKNVKGSVKLDKIRGAGLKLRLGAKLAGAAGQLANTAAAAANQADQAKAAGENSEAIEEGAEPQAEASGAGAEAGATDAGENAAAAGAGGDANAAAETPAPAAAAAEGEAAATDAAAAAGGGASDDKTEAAAGEVADAAGAAEETIQKQASTINELTERIQKLEKMLGPKAQTEAHQEERSKQNEAQAEKEKAERALGVQEAMPYPGEEVSNAKKFNKIYTPDSLATDESVLAKAKSSLDSAQDAIDDSKATQEKIAEETCEECAEHRAGQQ